MDIKNLLQEYIDNKVDALYTIQTLTAIFNPNVATDILALVNQITRLEAGDMDRDVFIDIWKLEKTKTKEYSDLTIEVQRMILDKGYAWRKKHRKHVDRVTLVLDESTEPFSSDLLHPEKWTKENWRWFNGMDDATTGRV